MPDAPFSMAVYRYEGDDGWPNLEPNESVTLSITMESARSGTHATRSASSTSATTAAIRANPKSAAAHNYLGITASQKGWQEAAEKEMLEAIAVNLQGRVLGQLLGHRTAGQR